MSTKVAFFDFRMTTTRDNGSSVAIPSFAHSAATSSKRKKE